VAGVDLGERRTKLVVLDGVGGRPALVGWADQPTPAGLFFGGRPVRPLDAGAWVRRLLGQAGVRPESLVMAVPGGDVQLKRLPVPDPGDRAATLRSLAASPAFRAGGEGGSGWSFDYHVLDPESGTVLAVAARREGIHAVQAVARAAGFPRERRWITVGEVALVNAWEAVAPDPAGRVILVDGGHTAVTVVLVENGSPLAWRRVLSAGRELEERSGGSHRSTDLPPHLAEEWGGRIVQEIRVVVGSVLRGAAGGELPPVMLGGGLARIGGVVDVLGRGLGAAVARFDPLAAPGAGARERGDGSRLGVAWGLATQVVARHLAEERAQSADPEVAA
jgi:Tfp pilus assembly PilM family ATPase